MILSDKQGKPNNEHKSDKLPGITVRIPSDFSEDDLVSDSDQADIQSKKSKSDSRGSGGS